MRSRRNRGSDVWPIAAATSRLADARSVRGIGNQADECGLGKVEIVRPGARGQRRRRGCTDSRILLRQHRPGERGGVLVADRAQRGDRAGPHRGIRIAEQTPDVGAPTCARCRFWRRRAPAAPAPGPSLIRGRGAAASPGCACRVIPARQSHRSLDRRRDSPAPAPAFQRWRDRPRRASPAPAARCAVRCCGGTTPGIRAWHGRPSRTRPAASPRLTMLN